MVPQMLEKKNNNRPNWRFDPNEVCQCIQFFSKLPELSCNEVENGNANEHSLQEDWIKSNWVRATVSRTANTQGAVFHDKNKVPPAPVLWNAGCRAFRSFKVWLHIPFLFIRKVKLHFVKLHTCLAVYTSATAEDSIRSPIQDPRCNFGMLTSEALPPVANKLALTHRWQQGTSPKNFQSKEKKKKELRRLPHHMFQTFHSLFRSCSQ